MTIRTNETLRDDDADNNHELGGTLGMAVGAVPAGILAGAAAGAAAGPVGAAVGAVVGAALGGGLGGKAGEGIAREINPTAEEEYWKNTYPSTSYYNSSKTYDHYRPAYRSGVDAAANASYQGKSFDQIEPELRNSWSTARGTSALEWDDARHASKDAYNRLYQN